MIPNLRKRFTAHVVFQGAEHRRWWRAFTRRGWRHCYVILPAHRPGAGLFERPGSIIVNPWVSCLRIDYSDRPPADLIRDVLADGATCAISIPVDEKFTGRYVPRGLMTCVSLVKAIVGCKAWNVWTPEQLAKWLLRNGGELTRNGQ